MMIVTRMFVVVFYFVNLISPIIKSPSCFMSNVIDWHVCELLSAGYVGSD